jgi:omega-6 fatty acid desaturase (delta-12 desaturase)
MQNGASPPHPSELYYLRPTNSAGFLFVAATMAMSGVGLWLSSHKTPSLWAIGQLVVAVTFVQWFVLLHECGHGTLFRSRPLHIVVGHIAGFFAIIPYPCWKEIHYRHHKWTGWQDVDPTTAALAPRPLGKFERALVNLCWKYWVPLFSVLYRMNNFWNIPRLMKLLQSQTRLRRRLLANIAAMTVIYATLAIVMGPLALVRLVGVALVLALIAEDVLLLSQHTHVPMTLSHGNSVDPYRAIEQAKFTRSMRLPAWLSQMWLHFDAHELHHMYPFVPGYRLRRVHYSPDNEVSWLAWVTAARAVPGEVFLFQNRNESGFDL